VSTGAIRDRETFIKAHTALARPPLTPEIPLWLATEATAIWEASEAFLEETGLASPFWAFAWPGGQALARYVLDNPETVRGKRVLDFGAGGGLAAIAAMVAGATEAVGADLDATAEAAMAVNAAENGVRVAAFIGDATALDPGEFDVILAADVCYERGPAAATTAWLNKAAGAGAAVLLADPGRTYAPTAGLQLLASYDTPTSRELERAEVMPTSVWRVVANSG